MPYDAQATRERLLDAAIAEFSALGLAGGRVDRIAASAQANKRAIYDYFGDKEGLFDAALSRVVFDLNAANPALADDLPAYAGRLFDYLQTHPEAVRMTTWWRLERPRLTTGSDDAQRELISAAEQWAGSDQIAGVDLLVLVLGLANAWFLSAFELLPIAGQDPGDPARLAAHRAMVVEAARRMTGPQPDAEPNRSA
jgi:AcrR family transcriptional regulator